MEDEREERKAPPPPPVPPVMSDIARKKGADDAAGSFIRRLLKDKRRLAIAGAVAVCVLLAPLAFLFGSGYEGQPPVQAVAEAPRPAQAIPDLPQEPAQPPVHLFQSAPYFIPTRGSEGQIRFLRCAYTLSTQNRLLYGELVQKRLILRDAVYHYLSNKPLSFLSDQQQLEGLKQDLLSVINAHVTADKLHELYF